MRYYAEKYSRTENRSEILKFNALYRQVYLFFRGFADNLSLGPLNVSGLIYTYPSDRNFFPEIWTLLNDDTLENNYLIKTIDKYISDIYNQLLT